MTRRQKCKLILFPLFLVYYFGLVVLFGFGLPAIGVGFPLFPVWTMIFTNPISLIGIFVAFSMTWGLTNIIAPKDAEKIVENTKN